MHAIAAWSRTAIIMYSQFLQLRGSIIYFSVAPIQITIFHFFIRFNIHLIERTQLDKCCRHHYKVCTYILLVDAWIGLLIALAGDEEVELDRDVPAPSNGVPSYNLWIRMDEALLLWRQYFSSIQTHFITLQWIGRSKKVGNMWILRMNPECSRTRMVQC